MSKINIYGVGTERRYIHTEMGAPTRYAKYGWQIRTFYNKKRKKRPAKLGLDRL